MPLTTALPTSFAKKIGVALVVAVLGLIAFSQTFVFIPAGHVGVLYDNGRGVVNQSLREGLNLTIPFWQKVTLFDARIQEYTMTAVPDEGVVFGDDSLDAPTSDGQIVKLDATILFRIEADKAPLLYQTIGADYVNKLIRPITRSQIRMVASRYTAPSIYSENRQKAEETMTVEIRDLLKDKFIIIDRVLLRSVNFSPEYTQAIEGKVIAEQRVEQAKFEVLEASQRAQARIQEAKGLAEAQALQRQTLTQEYLQLEALQKWDGKLPQVMGTGSVPFINLQNQ